MSLCDIVIGALGILKFCGILAAGGLIGWLLGGLETERLKRKFGPDWYKKLPPWWKYY